jgi:mannose-6-phosphate isomerase-like protein (cupin superfamily)
MSRIINKENADSYIWGTNCLSHILSMNDEISIKQELMPTGSKEQLHFHQNANQFFYILKGQATFYLEEEIFLLNPNDGLSVAKNTKHFIANESNDEIEFLVISQPNSNNDRINI